MPIWGDWKITWRQVLPPVLVVVAVVCLAYTVHGCRMRARSGIVRSPEQFEFYTQQLRSSEPAARAAAARLLGEHGNPAAIDELRPLLVDPDLRVVGAACAALGNLGDGDSTEAIFKLLSHQDPAVAAGAAEGLGALRCKKAVEPLVKLLGASDRATRLAVIVALGRIGDPAAAAPLKSLKPNPSAGLAPEPGEEERARLDEALNEALASLAGAE